MSNLYEITAPMPDNSATDRARQALLAADEFNVVTPDDYEIGGAALKAIKAKWKEIDDARKALKKPIDEAAKRVQEFFARPLDFLARAEMVYKRKLIGYSEEQERIRREEQRKADEKAERERQKLARQAEEARLAGKTERAETLDLRQAAVVAPIVQREAPKVAGTALREVWKFDITNEMEIPRGFLIVDESKIRKVVQAMKGDTNIPGVRVYSEKQLAAGTA